MSENDHAPGDGNPGQEDGERVRATPGSDQNETIVPPKITLAMIAEAWGGCSVAYVSKCKKAGCPVDSIEASLAWRVAHTNRGAGYRSKGKGEGENAESGPSQKVAIRRRKLATLEASLKAAIGIEEEALRLVELAIAKEKDELLALRISAYNKAKELRDASEKRYREHLVASRVLVPLDEAKDLVKKGWGPLLIQLRSVGKAAGPLANPDNDVLATRVISEEIEKAIALAFQEYEIAPAV